MCHSVETQAQYQFLNVNDRNLKSRQKGSESPTEGVWVTDNRGLVSPTTCVWVTDKRRSDTRRLSQQLETFSIFKLQDLSRNLQIDERCSSVQKSLKVWNKLECLSKVCRSWYMISQQLETFKIFKLQDLSRNLQIDERCSSVRKSPKFCNLSAWAKSADHDTRSGSN